MSRPAPASSLPPEIDRAMRDTSAMYMGVAEDAAEMAANATSETARVQALRVRLSALEMVGKISMERAKSELLDRLANRKPAAAIARDPRDDFGTSAMDEISVAGDN